MWFMQVTDFNQFKSGKLPAEYKIYAYNKYNANAIGQNKWQFVGSSTDKAEILETAKSLYKTQQFQKIEVKKNFFDKRQNRNAVLTLKIIDGRPERNLLIMAGMSVIFLAVLSLMFLEVL